VSLHRACCCDNDPCAYPSQIVVTMNAKTCAGCYCVFNPGGTCWPTTCYQISITDSFSGSFVLDYIGGRLYESADDVCGYQANTHTGGQSGDTPCGWGVSSTITQRYKMVADLRCFTGVGLFMSTLTAVSTSRVETGALPFDPTIRNFTPSSTNRAFEGVLVPDVVPGAISACRTSSPCSSNADYNTWGFLEGQWDRV